MSACGCGESGEVSRAAGIGQGVEFVTAADERQTGRKAVLGEYRSPDVTESELDRGFLEHRQEGVVCLTESFAHGLACCVTWWLWRALAASWPMERVLVTDLLHADDLGALLLAELRRRGLNLDDHLGNTLSNLSRRQMSPTWQWRQLHLVRRHESPALDGLDRSTLTSRFSLGLTICFVLDGSVVPHAGHWLAVDQCLGAV